MKSSLRPGFLVLLLGPLAACTGNIGNSGSSGSATGTPTGSPTGDPTGAAGTTGTATGVAGSTGTATGTAGTTGTATGMAGSTGTATGTAGTTGAAGTGAIVTPPPPTTCMPGVPKTTQVPRLTRVEYDHTTRDLLGIDVQPSSMLAPDNVGAMDQRAWDGFQNAADALATQVMASTAARAKVFPCMADTAACAMQFITTFGQKAFRRPLATAEVTRFMNFYTNKATLTENGTLDQSFQLILKSFLLSPSFLTRAEISEASPDGSGNFLLTQYEVASRLSYMLWGSMPDDMLFAAAAANQLSTSAQILTQAQRMLVKDNPKARARVAEFHAHYLLMGESTRWTEAAHDPVKFPAFKTSMVTTLADEAQRFLDYVTFETGGTFQDVILKPVAFVNRDTAPIYGLSAGGFGADLVMTTLDQAQRAGVFTQAGWLGAYSSYDRTSPILRGAFIEKDVLCRTIGSPPPDASATPLPTTGNTNRERVTAQTSPGACVGCHGPVVNPPGFALEAYDSIGAWQTTEKGTSFPIDTAADVVVGTKLVHVDGPLDLMAAIAASPEAQSCYAQKLVTHAFERTLTAQDLCTVQTLAGKMAATTAGSPYTILNLITDLTQSPSFRSRAKETP